MVAKICFNPRIFFGGISFIALVITVIIVSIILGFLYYSKQQVDFQQQLISEAKKSPQPNVIIQQPIQQRSRDSSYPVSRYVPNDSDFSNFSNVGYIFNDSGRFPLYMNRLNNRFYYFTRDDSRNNVKITIGNAEFGLKDEYFDGDTVSVPELSANPFSIKIYENSGNIYKPFPINF